MPIGYWRQGNQVTLLTKRFRQWWHNFEESAPVQLRMVGKEYTGTAQAITDSSAIIPVLTKVMVQHPRQAAIWHIRLDEDNQPNADDATAIAPKIVVILITLDAD